MNNSRKIAIFIHALTIGGAERVFINLANGFCKMGYDVDIVVLSSNGGFREKVNPRVKIVDLKSKRAITSVFKLKKYISDNKPAAILSALGHINVVSIIASIGSNTKTIVTEHSTNSIAFAKEGGIKAWIMPILMRFFYRYATHIVAVSKGVANDLNKNIKINQRIETIYNPTLPKELVELTEVDTKHEWLTDKNSKIVISVGRLAKVKQFDLLINAFSLLEKEVDAKLIILGDGPEREYLREVAKTLGIADKVDMPGFTTNPYAFMAKSDLFVLSSMYEGLPTVLVEALACGTAVVSTNCPSGPYEILEAGRLGILVDDANPKSLAVAMKKALTEPAPKAMPQDLQKYTLEYACSEYLKLIFEYKVD